MSGIRHRLFWLKKQVKKVLSGILPPEGLEWSSFLPDQFTSFSVNSGSGINMIVVNGDAISYEDLTGVTVVSQVGTANIQVVGNDLVPQNDGDLFGYELSNGIVCNLLESTNSFAYDLNGGDTGVINGATWINGQTQGEQSYLWGYNEYFYFDGSTNTITLPNTLDPQNGIEHEFIYYDTTNAVSALNYSLGTNARLSIGWATNGVGVYYRGANGVGFSVTEPKANFTNLFGKPLKVVVSPFTWASSTPPTVTVNGVQLLGTGSIAAISGIGTLIGGRTTTTNLFNSIVLNTIIDGEVFTPVNGYDNATLNGNFDKVIITGLIRESESDIFGKSISRKAVGLVDNAPSYSDHYRQIEAVTNDTFDTSGDYSLGMVLQVPSGTDGGTALTNGSMVVTIDEVNVTFTRNNGTILTYPHNNANAMFLCWVSQADGTTDLWVGDSNTDPLKVIEDGAAGAAAAGTIPLRTNNNNTLSDRLNGYGALAYGYNRLITDQEILDTYNFIKGGIPATTGFPLEFPITLP